MRILYIGEKSEHSTSAHRAAALRRLGHTVTHVDPRSPLPATKLIGGLSVRLGFGVLSPLIYPPLIRQVLRGGFDIAWVNGGAEIGPLIYRLLKQKGMRIVSYNNDDPFGGRDGRKWDLYRRSLRYHDLTIVVREPNVAEALSCGARQVHRVYMSYDPIAHAPADLTATERERWSSDVCFVGSWMPERGPFLGRLLELGVPLSLYGERWEKAPEWPRLRRAWRGPGIFGRDYVAAVQTAKVALGLLSVGNRDLHTQRSTEIPFIRGGLFCAQRTGEHQLMYRDGVEALYWSTPDECAAQCARALTDETFRTKVVEAAHRRLRELRLSNDEIVVNILGRLEARL